MKKQCLFFILIAFLCSCSNDTEDQLKYLLTELVEQAYMEGQVDCLAGDIRIEKTDTDYIWIKSPWDDGQEPIHLKRTDY